MRYQAQINTALAFGDNGRTIVIDETSGMMHNVPPELARQAVLELSQSHPADVP
jgi:hypothetical protein